MLSILSQRTEPLFTFVASIVGRICLVKPRLSKNGIPAHEGEIH